MSAHGQGGLAVGSPTREPGLGLGSGELWWLRPRVQRAAYRVALAVLIVVGVYFRSRRYWFDPLGLWVDEATWGIRLITGPLTKLEFRPIGYMALTKLVVTLHSDERTLRLWSYLAGLASLPITADLARYLFKSRLVRVLCLAVVAYNPLLIDMAREFKPYSLEFCVHLGLVWLFVRWQARHSRAWLGALLVASVLAFPLAYNIVFLLPSIFTVLGYTLLRAKAYRALLASVCAALAALAVMAAIYTSALRGTTQDRGGTERFWGKKYDVFYLPAATPGSHLSARLRWLADKYGDLAAFPGSHGNRALSPEVPLTTVTRKLGAIGAGAWLALHAVGIVALLVYRRRWLVLLVGPLLVTIAFNAISLWPFGAFRSNVFLLAYLFLIPMLGLDVLLLARRAAARLAGTLGSALLLVTNLSAGFEPHIRKHFFSTQTEMATLVRRMASVRAQQPFALRRHSTLVLVDSYTCTPFIFESRFSDSATREFGSLLRKDLDVRCMSSVSAARSMLRASRNQPFFVIVSDDRSMPAFAQMLRASSRIIVHERVRETHDLYFVTAR
jgi:hypothetical protein